MHLEKWLHNAQGGRGVRGSSRKMPVTKLPISIARPSRALRTTPKQVSDNLPKAIICVLSVWKLRPVIIHVSLCGWEFACSFILGKMTVINPSDHVNLETRQGSAWSNADAIHPLDPASTTLSQRSGHHCCIK